MKSIQPRETTARPLRGPRLVWLFPLFCSAAEVLPPQFPSGPCGPNLVHAAGSEEHGHRTGMLHEHFLYGLRHQDRTFDAIGVSLRFVTATRYSGRSEGMLGSHACSAKSPLAEPSFWVELSPCTGGDSGGQSLGDVGRIGGHAGRRARVARRMVAEGSRSRTIILRITQQT